MSLKAQIGKMVHPFVGKEHAYERLKVESTILLIAWIGMKTRLPLIRVISALITLGVTPFQIRDAMILMDRAWWPVYQREMYMDRHQNQ